MLLFAMEIFQTPQLIKCNTQPFITMMNSRNKILIELISREAAGIAYRFLYFSEEQVREKSWNMICLHVTYKRFI